MEMSTYRPELHVAQQSQREKLRIQQNSTPSQHLEDYTINFEQLPVHQQGLNPDLTQLRSFRFGNIGYDQSVLSSEMVNFATNSQVLLSHKDDMVMHQESNTSQSDKLIEADNSSFAKVSGYPQNCSTWKSIGSQQSYSWIVNNSGGSTDNIDRNQKPTFVGEGMPASSLYMKPNYYNYQDVQSSLSNPSCEISGESSPKQFMEMHCNSPLVIHQNALQEVVTGAAIGTRDLVFDGDQWNPLRVNNGTDFTNRPGEGCYQWNGEFGFRADKNTVRDAMTDNHNTQGLSLSLSSVPQFKTHVDQSGVRNDSKDSNSSIVVFNDFPDSKTLKSDYLGPNTETSICSKAVGGTCQDIVGTSTLITRRNTGPLGPFTGYATIMKSSKFLKPAHQLLSEFCSIPGPKLIRTGEVSDKISKEIRVLDDMNEAIESMVGAKGGELGASSSTFYNSNEISGEAEGGRIFTESPQPEYQKKKAKLLQMLELVCRKYKLYDQQMQMVVSSFESVAGLSAAIPYISLSLKTISRQFRCLKNAISDQLRHTRKREDLSSPTTGTSKTKVDASTSKLKYFDHSFQNRKSGGNSLGFFEPQHVWRPQRGLPERAVAILRAWLFDHFLHPYPTDTDKHMLATQTGLSRNQVSNWFINARVRVWKPMVEEIHVLETKGLAETNSNTDGKSQMQAEINDDQLANYKLNKNALSDKQVNCSVISSSGCMGDGSSEELWNQEKRSRVDCQIPASMGGSLLGFAPYQRSGIEIGGGGTVSLTLGLRQSADSVQQQQEHQLRQHFGSQMIRDYVG